MSTDVAIEDAIALLNHRLSPKRRAGAKRLRRLGDPAAGPALLEALQREVEDPRTWETQYQVIMDLGECRYLAALPFLEALSSRSFPATMVYVALGDAIVRLGHQAEDDPSRVFEFMRSGNDMLIDGAFRATATLRLRLSCDAVEQIVDLVTLRPAADGLRFWVAAAAAGWDCPGLQAFLSACLASPRDDVRQAAMASLQQTYRTWHYL